MFKKSTIAFVFPFFSLSACMPFTSSEYTLTDSFVGKQFLDSFNWFNAPDPTHGRVKYVDKDTALKTNLSWAGDTQFVMRADDWSKTGDEGRPSVRIQSQKTFGDGIYVLDVAHMPEGCGTWPAFWTVTPGQWPNGGEIDILEGTNNQKDNLVSLHTSASCSMAGVSRTMTGTSVHDDCAATSGSNTGCSISLDPAASPSAPTSSYGSSFNANGGGWYAMQRDSNSGIFVWFWPRNGDGVNGQKVPDEVKYGYGQLDTTKWGTPAAAFSSQNCDIRSHFTDHTIVFDLTFCGDWAGDPGVYNTLGCPGTCSDFVDNNPSAFSNAFWTINGLKVYQHQ